MAFIRKSRLVLAPVGTLAAKLAQGIDVSALRCTFRVKNTLVGSPPKPTHAEIEVYNLNRFSQSFVSSTPAVAVSLEVGYVDEGTQQIYLGEVRTGDTRQVGPNYVTKLVTDDKGRKLQKTQIHVGIAPATPVKACIQTILQAFNVAGGPWGDSVIGEGNLEFAMGELAKKGITSLYPKGGMFSGYAVDELTDLCRGCNMEWFIQGGALFLRLKGSPLGSTVLSLSGSSGLVGSPSLDNEGRLTAEALLLPGIVVGSVVEIDAKFIQGAFRLIECQYRGDTHGNDWHVVMKGVRY